jgi:hypothetical protein
MNEVRAAQLWEESQKKLDEQIPQKLSSEVMAGYREFSESISKKHNYHSDWISPFDCLFILKEIEKHNLKNIVVVDTTGGNFSLEFLQSLELQKLETAVSIVANDLPSNRYRELATDDRVIAITSDHELENSLKDADVVIARFGTMTNKFDSSGKCLKFLLTSDVERHLFLHEFYPYFCYPFQYYQDLSSPNLLDVFELLTASKRLEFLGDTWHAIRSIDQDLQPSLKGFCNSTLIGHFRILKSVK